MLMNDAADEMKFRPIIKIIIHFLEICLEILIILFYFYTTFILCFANANKYFIIRTCLLAFYTTFLFCLFNIALIKSEKKEEKASV